MEIRHYLEDLRNWVISCDRGRIRSLSSRMTLPMMTLSSFVPKPSDRW
ncbi:hypothetical protein KBT16_19125 [Nostoc sp. CCCryo 231-06]|nr:hypothetical protein [Nostoc sp. CCCryo 231-06]